MDREIRFANPFTYDPKLNPFEEDVQSKSDTSGETTQLLSDKDRTDNQKPGLYEKKFIKPGRELEFCILLLCTLLFFMSFSIMVISQSEYAMYRTLMISYSNSSEANGTGYNLTSEQGQALEKEISTVLLAASVVQLLPSIVAVMYLGAWSDVSRRRAPCLYVPALGLVVWEACLIIDFYRLPPTYGWLYIGSLLSGIAGADGLPLSGALTIAGDLFTLEGRTLGLSLIVANITFGIGIAQVLNGYIIEYGGYNIVFFFSLVLSFACLALGLFIKETKEPRETSLKKIGTAIKSMLNVCVTSKLKGAAWMYIIAFAMHSLVFWGKNRFTIIFLELAPLLFSAIHSGWWLATTGLLQCLGICLITFYGKSKFKDITFLYVSLILSTGGVIFLGFSTSFTMAFIATPFIALLALPLSVFRSAISKTFFEADHGLVFAFLQTISTVMALVGPLMFTSIFTVTVSFFKGTVFMIAAFLLAMCIPFIYIGNRKEEMKKAKGIMEGQY